MTTNHEDDSTFDCPLSLFVSLKNYRSLPGVRTYSGGSYSAYQTPKRKAIVATWIASTISNDCLVEDGQSRAGDETSPSRPALHGYRNFVCSKTLAVLAQLLAA